MESNYNKVKSKPEIYEKIVAGSTAISENNSIHKDKMLLALEIEKFCMEIAAGLVK